MQKPNPSMTSLEAAALILSEGKTTDVEQAELYSQGKLLDPEALERAYYRRALGFDLDVIPNPEKHHYVVKDKELGFSTTASMTDDRNKDAARIAKAVMRVKAMHDKHLDTQEGEVV